jgi:hypothetical protein
LHNEPVVYLLYLVLLLKSLFVPGIAERGLYLVGGYNCMGLLKDDYIPAPR